MSEAITRATSDRRTSARRTAGERASDATAALTAAREALTAARAAVKSARTAHRDALATANRTGHVARGQRISTAASAVLKCDGLALDASRTLTVPADVASGKHVSIRAYAGKRVTVTVTPDGPVVRTADAVKRAEAAMRNALKSSDAVKRAEAEAVKRADAVKRATAVKRDAVKRAAVAVKRAGKGSK